MKVWVAIPAYNEAEGIGDILAQLKKKDVSILIVDDGSIDGTHNIARRYADSLIRNEMNLGKGRSLTLAFEYLLKSHEFDYLITMDGDGQHCPSDLDIFLDKARVGTDFVVGNRMDDPFGMPKLRIITNKFMSWFISKIIGYKIADTQCGFRLIKRQVLEKIKITTAKYEIESETLIKAAKAGFKITSIPIKSIYHKGAKSKIDPFIDTLRFVRFISNFAKNKS